MTWIGRWLWISILIGWGSSCFAQTVTIRVIDGKNGRPLAGQGINVSLLYDGVEKAPAEFSGQLNFQTDDKGEAHVTLAQPPPAHLAVSARVDQSRWQCPCTVLDSTENVVRFGIVKGGQNNKTAIKPESGAVIFVARPLSFIYRLLGPLEKG